MLHNRVVHRLVERELLGSNTSWSQLVQELHPPLEMIHSPAGSLRRLDDGSDHVLENDHGDDDFVDGGQPLGTRHAPSSSSSRSWVARRWARRMELDHIAVVNSWVLLHRRAAGHFHRPVMELSL